MREAVRSTSVRRLLTLVQHLPPDSAVARSTSAAGGWTQQHELLAASLEALHGVAWQLNALRHERAGKRGPKHKPVRFEHPDRAAPSGAEKTPVPPRVGLQELMKRIGG